MKQGRKINKNGAKTDKISKYTKEPQKVVSCVSTLCVLLKERKFTLKKDKEINK
jgi:hypothetical protein